jgi:hypothetical protein
MRFVLALFFVLPCVGVSAASAQVDYYARIGLSATTKLVRDRILQDIEVRQNLAPTVVVGASLPIAALYRAGLEATVTTAGFHSAEAGTDTDLGNLRTGSITLGLGGPIWHTLGWRAGAGLIAYWPGDRSGIFLQGGSTRFLAGVGVDYRHKVMPRWDFMASLRYDFHRFRTDELVARGFSGTQGVQRISVTLGLAQGNQ